MHHLFTRHHRPLLPRGAWLAALALLLLATAGCGNRRQPPAPEVEMTPVAGGATMVAPTPPPTPTPTPDAPPPGLSITPGVVFVVVTSDGGGVAVRSDVGTDALVMDLYEDGATFTVVAPSGKYQSYPVEAGGVTWVRVRTTDGLVGWVRTDRLAPAE